MKKGNRDQTNTEISSIDNDIVPDSENVNQEESSDEESIVQKQKKIVIKKFKQKKSKVGSSSIITTTQIPSDRKLQVKDESKDLIEFVLGDFHDFHRTSELKKFQCMSDLSLIYESIKDITTIINNLPDLLKLKYLCLNQNEIKNLDCIEKLENLEELQVNFNLLEKIPTNLSKLKNLKKFWACDNKIEKIENIPTTVTNLWLANNLIKYIPDDFEKYENMEFINISGNFLNDFRDLYILEKIKTLKKIYLSDINFGENPICLYSNYRQIMIHIFKEIEVIDQIYVTPEERKNVESLYIKKNILCKNKIRQNHKITKMIFQLMKTNKLFLTNMKYHQIRFFSQRQKMLEYAKYEKLYLDTQNETNLDEIQKEIDISSEKVNNCLQICHQINKIFNKLKNYLSDLNDLSIVTYFYELESNGNFKIEPGNNSLKWVKSCLDLMKFRIPQDFFTRFNFTEIIFKQIYKITNKKVKFTFDALYESLIDKNNKFGEEQKYFDFFFLVLPNDILKDYRKLLHFLFEENYENQDFVLCDNISYIDSFNLIKNNQNPENENNEESNDSNSDDDSEDNNEINNKRYIAIICKCAIFDSMIEEVTCDKFFDNFDEVKEFLKEKAKKSQKEIIKLFLKNKDVTLYYYNLKGIIAPEYIIEYFYEKKKAENKYNLHSFVSSFNTKLVLNNEYESLFNICAQHSFNPMNKLKQYFNKEIINKYSLSKFGEFKELENNFLFFAENSILTFISNCFKYQSYQEYLNEINKINEKIKEISNLKFQTNFEIVFNKYVASIKTQEVLINNNPQENNEKNSETHERTESQSNVSNASNTKNPKKEADTNEGQNGMIKFEKMKILNLFNLNLTNDYFDNLLYNIKNESIKNSSILNFTKNCEEIVLCKNKLTKIDLSKLLDLFPNLMKIDLSHNYITTLLYTQPSNSEIKYSLASINISYNNISEFSNILLLLNNFENLTQLILFANPFLKFCENIIENIDENDLTTNEKQNIINDYNSYLETKKSEGVIIKISSEDDSKINTTNKNYDYVYDCFSFSDKYHSFSDNIYFREKIHTEKHYNTLILSKRKLFCVPTVEGKSETQVLYVNLNKISTISNLEQFNNLKELYIQNNKIQKIENLPLGLIKLDISNNELSSLEGIEKASQIEWLNFENNGIKTICQVIKLPNIKELYCAGNFISNPKECCQLGKLKKLEILDVSGNDVCRIVRDLRVTMIYYCRTLTNFNRINVDEQEKIKAKEYFTGKLTSEVLEKRLGSGYNTNTLIELDLSSLKLKDELNLFSKETYPKLTKLNLSRNIFKSFSIFGYLPYLIELNLNYNLFTEILPKNMKIIKGKGIYGLPNLESLEFAGNQLNNINGIQCFTKLKILVLRENSLSKIDSINHMEYLTFLDVSFNKLRNCDRSNVGILPSLQVFLCDNNYLKNINGFEKFQSVQSISFENNKIPDYNSLEKLANLENLKDLAITNNPITKQINYRNTMIRMFPFLLKLDSKEITNEEREMIAMEMQMGADNGIFEDDIDEMYGIIGPDLNQKKIMNSNYNYTIQKLQDKALKRVNYVQIGYMMPFPSPNGLNQNYLIRGRNDGPPVQMQLSPLNKKTLNNLLCINNNNNLNINLPQIKKNVNNTIIKPITSESRKRVGSHNSNNLNGSTPNININSILNNNKSSNNINTNKVRSGSIQQIGRPINVMTQKQDYFNKVTNSLSNEQYQNSNTNTIKFTPGVSSANFNSRKKQVNNNNIRKY